MWAVYYLKNSHLSSFVLVLSEYVVRLVGRLVEGRSCVAHRWDLSWAFIP
jgi:hypothetical protein